MCKVARQTKIGNVNVKVIKEHENKIIGTRIELTRKMRVDGVMIYAVVITNMRTGRHYKILTFNGLGEALKTYKEALA